MEKAKLSIAKAKSGKYIVNVILGSNKTQPVPNFNPKGTELNGKEVEIERQSGKIIKIACEGREIFSVSPAAHTASISPCNHASNIIDPAWAPYNFVPLNETVVEAEEMPSFDRYYIEEGSKRYTGYIKIDIETKTPLYIRDTLNEAEIKQADEAEKRKQKFINSDFFSPTGDIRIPGSSLRGITRNMVEIVSFGKFGFFNGKRLYFRAVADRSKLGSDYKALMVDEGDNYFPRIKAGILNKVNQSYVIYPSKILPKGSNGTQIYRINFNKATKVINGTTNFVVPPFEFRDIYFNPVSPVNHTHTMPNGRKHQLKYALLTSVSQTKNSSHPQLGFIIASGEFGNKKHMHWVINEPDNNYVTIEESVIKEYKEDYARDERANLLEKLKEHPNGVPCFYIDDSTRIISFGHTGMFRLAYTKTISEHILPKLKDESKIDIAEAIFGNEKTFAGRVFFEDAYLLNPTNNDFEDEKIPKTLLGPKPTAFQHYVVQTEENLQNHPKNLSHYNMDTAIRGNKLYWHKSPDWVKENQNDFNSQIDTKIKSIKANKTFTGRIRFENLSRVELGALLFALALPSDCCHKLGMGKPLGLGSVRITPTLYISNRKNRYTDLLAEWENQIQESTNKGETVDDFKKEFQSYVLNELGEKTVTDLWEVNRMKELKRMLDFEKKPSDDKTKYMKLADFRQRKVLPKPTEVK